MNHDNPIEEVWNLLAGQRKRLVESFYDNLFIRFPHYHQYFPEHMEPQTERMMDLVGSVARFSNQINLIRPYLLKVGESHKTIQLKLEDLCNFRDVFIDTVAETCGASWEERHAEAFREAFDDTIIPIVHEGLSGPSIDRDCSDFRVNVALHS